MPYALWAFLTFLACPALLTSRASAQATESTAEIVVKI
jgi:hypothetical protein